MSLIDRQISRNEKGVLDLSQHKIELVLSRAESSALDKAEAAATGLSLVITELELDAPLPEAIAARAAILCIEAAPSSQASIDRIAKARREHPDLPIVAAVRDADLTLVRALLRQGVRDVVALPISARQLGESLCDLLSDMHPAAKENGPRGQLISVVKSIGGVGATNVGVHLATALAEAHAGSADKGTCLFDLDVQFGNASTYLGAPAGPSLQDLLDGGTRVDRDFLRTIATTLPTGLHFVAPPPEIGPLEAIDAEQLQRILGVARAEYDHVIADMPGNWANWTLSVVAQSDVILLVVNLTIASLKQGKRQLHLLRTQGIDPKRIVVLVNRVEQRLFKTIGLEDAAKALGHPVDLWVHNDYALVNAANNQGIVVSELNRRSKVAKDFARIAETLPALVGGKD